MMISNDKTLTAKLRLWAATRDDRHLPGDHLADERLYQAARKNGLAALSENERHHLARCPRCLHEWAEWLHALADEDEPAQGREHDIILTCATLQAAATTQREPVRLRTQCGRFFLSLLPQVEDRRQGLMTLEVAVSGEDQLDGWRVSVRDRNGRRLLEGTLHNGRLARPCEELDKVDLALCTVVLQRPRDEEPQP